MFPVFNGVQLKSTYNIHQYTYNSYYLNIEF